MEVAGDLSSDMSHAPHSRPLVCNEQTVESAGSRVVWLGYARVGETEPSISIMNRREQGSRRRSTRLAFGGIPKMIEPETRSGFRRLIKRSLKPDDR